MRTALSNVHGVTDIAVSLENKIARFKLDACCVPLQAVVKSVNGGSHNFRASVAFALPSVSEEKLGAVTQALSKVPGVSRVRRPSGERLLLIELDGKKQTLLGDLTQAAKKLGITLTLPSIQTNNLPEVK